MKLRATTKKIGDSTTKNQESTEGNGVGRNDPFHRAATEAQRAANRRQRNVHDAEIEDDHE
jgi:hypothetical protein